LHHVRHDAVLPRGRAGRAPVTVDPKGRSIPKENAAPIDRNGRTDAEAHGNFERLDLAPVRRTNSRVRATSRNERFDIDRAIDQTNGFGMRARRGSEDERIEFTARDARTGEDDLLARKALVDCEFACNSDRRTDIEPLDRDDIRLRRHRLPVECCRPHDPGRPERRGQNQPQRPCGRVTVVRDADRAPIASVAEGNDRRSGLRSGEVRSTDDVDDEDVGSDDPSERNADLRAEEQSGPGFDGRRKSRAHANRA